MRRYSARRTQPVRTCFLNAAAVRDRELVRVRPACAPAGAPSRAQKGRYTPALHSVAYLGDLAERERGETGVGERLL